MNVKRIALLGVPVLALAAVLPLSATARGSQHVRWDNGGSGAVTGGGTWVTASGSGTYVVKELVTWVFANHASQTPTFVDNIGNSADRANGTAVLRVRFSDGQSGVLTVGCHGPGAPPGIFEGIATTKGYKTYYASEDPVGGVDANRTLFHIVK